MSVPISRTVLDWARKINDGDTSVAICRTAPASFSSVPMTTSSALRSLKTTRLRRLDGSNGRAGPDGTIRWDLRAERGRLVAPGTYFVRTAGHGGTRVTVLR